MLISLVFLCAPRPKRFDRRTHISPCVWPLSGLSPLMRLAVALRLQFRKNVPLRC